MVTWKLLVTSFMGPAQASVNFVNYINTIATKDFELNSTRHLKHSTPKVKLIA